MADARTSSKARTTKSGSRTKIVDTGTYRNPGTDTYEMQATKTKSKRRGGKHTQKSKTVKADSGVVKKTTISRKSGDLPYNEKTRTKNVGTKRAGKMVSRAKAKQSRMDKKAARVNRNPAMGRDIPLPKSR